MGSSDAAFFAVLFLGAAFRARVVLLLAVVLLAVVLLAVVLVLRLVVLVRRRRPGMRRYSPSSPAR
ncbi:hypothetical protein [Blastococcus sp. LR1]|uniref:hypothetical protein n=1 Tax=Blastococcus sp. LR1 TaxID=2877000 RepID=UPI001CCE3DAF|nr:hypothetical protein [Blastococcus sp. LR1]MCA0147122.1 hypothetical protein [Blastococcus sp. LR1]